MRKRILLTILILSLISIDCFAAVSIKPSDVRLELSTVTATGKAEKGDVVGYSLTLKGEDKNDVNELYAVGDVVAGENGDFTIIFEFPDNSPNGMYTLNYGIMGEAAEPIDIEYVEFQSAINALQNAENATALKNILKKDSGYYDGLTYIGFDIDTYSLLEKPEDVCQNIFDNCKLSESSIDEILTTFNTYLGIGCINERKSGGIKYINPIFETVAFVDIKDTSLVKYLEDGIYRSSYTTIDEFNKNYVNQNVLYKIENVAVGSFAELIQKYEVELEVKDTDFYKEFTDDLSSTQQNSVAIKYFEYTETSNVYSVNDFVTLFKKAINDISTETPSVTPGGSTGGGSFGGGGSGGGSGSGKGSTQFATIVTPIEPQQTTPVKVFNDLDDVEWAKEAIAGLAEKEIISGVSDGKFAPNDTVTREQIVKMVILSLDIEPTQQVVPFNDVIANHWYAPYIAESYNRGLINGIGNEKFGVGSVITRQDLAVVIVRAAKVAGLDGFESNAELKFDDNSEIADYAKDAVSILAAKGIVNGKGNNCFKPNDSCTRAEAAKIIYNVFFGR